MARLVTSVGGGYGDPLSRDLALVRQDVRNELLTVADARRLYGVVLDAASLVVNGAATATLRQERMGKQGDPGAQLHKM